MCIQVRFSGDWLRCVSQVHIQVIGSGVYSGVYLRCVAHLQAGDGQAARVVRQRGDRDNERRVWDVFVIELDGHLVVTWRSRQLI